MHPSGPIEAQSQRAASVYAGHIGRDCTTAQPATSAVRKRRVFAHRYPRPDAPGGDKRVTAGTRRPHRTRHRRYTSPASHASPQVDEDTPPRHGRPPCEEAHGGQERGATHREGRNRVVVHAARSAGRNASSARGPGVSARQPRRGSGPGVGARRPPAAHACQGSRPAPAAHLPRDAPPEAGARSPDLAGKRGATRCRRRSSGWRSRRRRRRRRHATSSR